MATLTTSAATARIQIYEAMKDKSDDDFAPKDLLGIFSKTILKMIQDYDRTCEKPMQLDFKWVVLEAHLDSRVKKILKKHFPDLTSLIVTDESAGKTGHRLKRLSGLKLTELHLSNCHISDNSLKHLLKLPKLTTLNLIGCEALTDQGLAQLSDCQFVSVSLGNSQITHQGVNYLGNPSLRSLTLVNCPIDLSKLGAFEGLEELVLAGPYTAEQIGQLPKFPNLKKLDIQNCPNAKDKPASSCTIS